MKLKNVFPVISRVITFGVLLHRDRKRTVLTCKPPFSPLPKCFMGRSAVDLRFPAPRGPHVPLCMLGPSPANLPLLACSLNTCCILKWAAPDLPGRFSCSSVLPPPPMPDSSHFFPSLSSGKARGDLSFGRGWGCRQDASLKAGTLFPCFFWIQATAQQAGTGITLNQQTF